MSDREFEGLRVVEYGPWFNAAYAGKLLADLGATVVKAESPDGADPTRLHGPFPGDLPDAETSAVHLYLNTNKLGVTLDPTSATGRRLFKALAAWADVLIEGTSAGELETLGLDYPHLEKLNPRLIMTSVTSLGRSGPYASYKSYDLTSWHGSGASHPFQGEPDREPLWGAWYNASHWGGVNAACAATIALRARELTGRGQYIDVSEAEALATLYLAVEVSDFHDSGNFRVRLGVEGRPSHAPSSMRRAKDRWAYVMALAPHQWEGLVKSMGNPEWAQSPIFKGTSRERAPYVEEITLMMTPWFESHTASEIFEICQSNGVPAAPVNTVQDLLNEHHLHERGYFPEIDHPVAGRFHVPGAPFRISGDPWRIDRPAPLLGQHNEEVYCDILGIPKSDLPPLYRAGVI